MVDNQIQKLLHEFANTSWNLYGSYSHCAGFYESLLGMLLSGTMTKDEVIKHLTEYMVKNQ